MTNYQIDVLKVGEIPEIPGYWTAGDDEWTSLVVYALLIRDGENTILVNSGPSLEQRMQYTWSDGRQHRFVFQEEDLIENRLAVLGIYPEDIQHLILTPLISYATGGMDKFPNAQIYVNREGWGDLFAPRYKNHTRTELYQCIEPRLINYAFTSAWERMVMMKQEHCILPGIDIFWVGTHSRSSVAIKISTDKGCVIFSDCMFCYENITENLIIGVNENMYEALDAYERIRNEASIIVPMYDPRVLQQHPNGHIA